MNILIFSKDKFWHGGVVNFIETLKDNFSSDIAASQFLIGLRRGNLGLILRPITPVVDGLRLTSHLLFNKYDCYHLNPSLNGPSLIRDGLFLFILKSFGCRNIIICFHGWELPTEKIIEASWWRRWLFTKLFCNVACQMVLARQFKDWLIRLGANENRIHIFTTMFDGRLIVNHKRDKYKQGDDINFLFLSRFVRGKGIFELLAAFKMLRQKYTNIHLTFAGTGSEEKAMKKWVEKNSLSDNIEFKGYVRGDEKTSILNISHVFVLPSYSEGCPVSLLEAMAAGMAVITTPVGGIPDIIENIKNGIFIKDNVSPETVFNAIDQLLSEPGCITSIGENNRIEAWKKYNAAVVTRSFERIYRNNCMRNDGST